MTTPGSPRTGADPAPGDAPLPDGAGVTVADRIQTAVLGCPTVAGVAVTPASYLPGHDVAGVDVTDDAVEVHVIATYDQPIVEIGNQVGKAVAGLLAGRALHVFVDDILLPGETPPPTPAELLAAARDRAAQAARTTAEAGRRGATTVRDVVRDTADDARARLERTRDEAGEIVDRAAEKVDELADEADEVKARAADKADEVEDRAVDRIADTADAAADKADDVADQAHDVADRARDVADRTDTRSAPPSH